MATLEQLFYCRRALHHTLVSPLPTPFLSFGRTKSMTSTKLTNIYKLATIDASIVIATAIGVCIPVLRKTIWALRAKKGILIHNELKAFVACIETGNQREALKSACTK
jgi:hypothetical protein